MILSRFAGDIWKCVTHQIPDDERLMSVDPVLIGLKAHKNEAQGFSRFQPCEDFGFVGFQHTK